MAGRGTFSVDVARSAFTLTELVVVLVIVGTLASVAIPRYAASMTVRRAQAAADLLLSDLADARHASSATSRPLEIAFDVDAESYSVSGFAGGPARVERQLAVEPYGASVDQAVFVAEGVAEPATTRFAYDILGRPRATGSSTFTGSVSAAPLASGEIVIAAGPRSVRMLLDATTGYVIAEAMR